MFYGESTHSLDAKKRVFVPKRFQNAVARDEDGHLSVVVTRGFEGCLFLFSVPQFEVLRERLRTQPFVSSKLRKMQRLFFSSTHPCTLDGSGRLVIPEKLRKLAGIESDVVMVGVSDRAEIWDRERWLAFESDSDDDFDELDVVLMGTGAAAEGGD